MTKETESQINTIFISNITMTVTNPNTVDPLINALGQMNLNGAVEANTNSTDKVSNVEAVFTVS